MIKRTTIVLMMNYLVWNTLFAATEPTKPPAAKANTPPAPPILTQTQVKTKVDDQAIKTINDQFKIVVKSADQIAPVIAQFYMDYYAKLRQCTPGTYKYALPSPNGGSYHKDSDTIDPLYYFPVSVIQGLHENKCNVDTKYALEGIGDVEMKCQYLQTSLQHFTDAEAKYAVNGNLDVISPTSQMNMDQCQVMINGVPYN